MSEQELLQRSLGRVLPQRRTPWVAIVVTTVAAMVLTATGDLQSLAETVVLLLLVVFISTNTAVLVLRKDKVDHKPFRPARLIPYLALACCLLLLSQQGIEIWIRAAVLIAIGLVMYFVPRWISTKSRRGAQRKG